MTQQLEIKIVPIQEEGKYVCKIGDLYLAVSYNVYGKLVFKLHNTSFVLGVYTYFTLKEAKFVAKSYLKSLEAKKIKTIKN